MSTITTSNVEPNKNNKTNKNNKSSFKTLIKPNLHLFTLSIAATAFGAIFQLLAPLIIRFTVDSVISNQPIDAPAFIVSFIERIGGVSFLRVNLWVCALAVISVSLGEGLFTYMRGHATSAASENVAKKLKDTLYMHIQKLPYNYHVKAQTGDLIQRCTSDVETVRNFLGSQVAEVVRTVFMVVFSVYIMLGTSVKMTLVTVITVPVIFVIAIIFFRKVKSTFMLSDQKEGEMSAALQENLSGVRVVRAFGRQKYEMEKFDKKNSEFRNLSYKLIHYLALYWGSSDLFCFAQILLVLVVGINMTIAGEITLGSLWVFDRYVGMLLWPVRHMGRILSDMGKMQISLGRINEILNTPEETDTEGATEHNLKGDIVFENVNFSYDESKQVLNNLTFTVKKGETIAILGTTGSGKSTIMHILLRLYDYNSGSVKINGKEITEIKKQTLREKIGIVLQEPFLFSKTIKENIQMANSRAGDFEVESVSKAAAIHDSISRFEKGYDTIVGEKGVTLSGGQKQRIAIARTLIKNSEILIFDDSLSAVDTETDAQIRRALSERKTDVTTFIISQRITTLMEADRIFIIENGRITGCGKHEELIKTEGLYKRIWDIQTMLEGDFESEAAI
ncbi:MAG: ABC transporter ATP-binding protein/permease [Clostridiales bacterium]|nr:ABC transporter ATP-binding protein/permease [Clostridiales bacterium]